MIFYFLIETITLLLIYITISSTMGPGVKIDLSSFDK